MVIPPGYTFVRNWYETVSISVNAGDIIEVTANLFVKNTVTSPTLTTTALSYQLVNLEGIAFEIGGGGCR